MRPIAGISIVFIDYTVLSIDADKEAILDASNVVKSNDYSSLCVRPEWTNLIAKNVRTTSVIGFPDKKFNAEQAVDKIGAVSFDKKKYEVKKALKNGVLEIDPVIEVSRLYSNNIEDHEELIKELYWYFEAVHKVREKEWREMWVKPIFSSELLPDTVLELSVSILCHAYVKFIGKYPDSKVKIAYKTSTGYVKSPSIDIIKSIQKIKKFLFMYGHNLGITIKAAGGIKTAECLERVLKAGGRSISHVGTSTKIKYRP